MEPGSIDHIRSREEPLTLGRQVIDFNEEPWDIKTEVLQRIAPWYKGYVDQRKALAAKLKK